MALVSNVDFVSETFSEDTPPGKRELWHGPETDVYVLAHVQQAGKGGNPHTRLGHGGSALEIIVGDVVIRAGAGADEEQLARAIRAARAATS